VPGMLPERAPAASVPVSTGSPRSFWSWPIVHYKAGFVAGLLVFDALVVGVCLIDVQRFVSRKLTISAAWQLAGETVGQTEIIQSLIVLGFFLLVVPFVAGLVPSVFSSGGGNPGSPPEEERHGANEAKFKTSGGSASDESTWPRLLLRRGWLVVAAHLVVVLFIVVLTVAAQSMQTLCGPENDASSFSFAPYWLGAVSGIQWVSSAVFLPVFLKFASRFFGHEHPNPGDVIREGFTELPTELGH